MYTRIDRIIWMQTAVGIAKKPELMEFTDLSLVIGTNVGIHALVCIACVVHNTKYRRGLACWFLIRARFYLHDLSGYCARSLPIVIFYPSR